MNTIQEKLFEVFDIYFEKMNIKNITEDIPSIVKSIDKDKIKVNINGIDYIASNGLGIRLKVGTPVWLHAMQGDMNQLYIISIR